MAARFECARSKLITPSLAKVRVHQQHFLNKGEQDNVRHSLVVGGINTVIDSLTLLVWQLGLPTQHHATNHPSQLRAFSFGLSVLETGGLSRLCIFLHIFFTERVGICWSVTEQLNQLSVENIES